MRTIALQLDCTPTKCGKCEFGRVERSGTHVCTFMAPWHYRHFVKRLRPDRIPRTAECLDRDVTGRMPAEPEVHP